jgi:hypothetical protein
LRVERGRRLAARDPGSAGAGSDGCEDFALGCGGLVEGCGACGVAGNGQEEVVVVRGGGVGAVEEGEGDEGVEEEGDNELHCNV